MLSAVCWQLINVVARTFKCAMWSSYICVVALCVLLHVARYENNMLNCPDMTTCRARKVVNGGATYKKCMLPHVYLSIYIYKYYL